MVDLEQPKRLSTGRRKQEELSDSSSEDDRRTLKKQTNVVSSAPSIPINSIIGNRAVASNMQKIAIPHPSTAVDPTTGIEGHPRTAFFHDSYEIAVDGMLDIISSVQNTHKPSPAPSSLDLDNACGDTLSDIEALLTADRVASPIVVVGSQGKGKSSCINSVLMQPGIAYESDTVRGTFVVTYYKGAQPDQSCNFVIDLHFHPDSDIEQQISELVRFCCRSGNETTFRLEDLDEEEQDADVDDEDTAQEKRSAMKCLDDMLIGSELLQGRGVESYLKHMLALRSEDTHSTMIKEITQAVTTAMGEMLEESISGTRTFRCNTAEEMRDIIGRLSRVCIVNNRPVRSLWPLLRHIDVYVRNAVLEAGVILADTPGMDDDNTKVVANTYTAIQNAGILVIVHDRDRPEANGEVCRAIRTSVRHGKIDRTVLVLTKKDEIRGCRQQDRVSLSESARGRLDEAAEVVRTCEVEVERASREFTALLSGAADQHAIRAANARQERAKSSLEHSRRAQHAVKINIAIEGNRIALRDGLADLLASTGTSELPVFYISNTEYSRLAGVELGTGVELHETGVPQLRGYLLRFVHKEDLDILRTAHLQLDLALSGIAAILAASPHARNDALRLALNEKLSQEPVLPLAYFADLFTTHVGGPLLNRDHHFTSRMVQKVLAFSSNIKAPTVRALLNRNGIFKSSTSNTPIDWNEELSMTFRDEVFNNWISMNRQCVIDAEALVTDIGRHFEAVAQVMVQAGQQYGFDVTEANRLIRLRAEEHRIKFRNAVDAFFGRTNALVARVIGIAGRSKIQAIMSVAYMDSMKITAKKPTPAGCRPPVGKLVTQDRINGLVNYTRDTTTSPTGFPRTDSLYRELTSHPNASNTLTAVLRRQSRADFIALGAELRGWQKEIYQFAKVKIEADLERRFFAGTDGHGIPQEVSERLSAMLVECQESCAGEIAGHINNCVRYETEVSD